MKKAIVSIIIQARDKSGRAVKKALGGIKGLTRSIFSMGTAMAALSTGAIALGIKALFTIGSEAEETASKFQTVFGAGADALDAFNESFGALAGLSKTEARDVISVQGAIAQGFGFSQEASADFAKEVVRLGADLASFNNLQGGTAAGIDIVRSGLTGEMERLKKLGIVLRSVDVEQRAMLITGKKTKAELTQQEIAMARLALITEKAGVAVGDLERTQSSMANTARRLGAVIRTIKEDFASMFLESFKLIGGFTSSAESISKFSKKLKENRNEVVAWMAATINSVKFIASAFATGFKTIFNLLQILTNSFVALVKAFGSILAGDFADAKRIFSGLKESIVRDLADIAEGADNTAERMDTMLDSIKRAVQESKGIDTGIGEEVGRDKAGDFTPPPLPQKIRADRIKDFRLEVDKTIERMELLSAQFDLGIIDTGQFGLAVLEFSRRLAEFRSNADLTDEQLVELLKTMRGLHELAAERNPFTVDPSTLPLLQQVGLAIKSIFTDATSLGEVLANIGTRFLEDFASAVESAFKAWVDGSKSAADAFKGAMLEAIAAVARATGQLFLGKAAGALAEGLLGNPAAFAAAAKFTGAAALLFGLAGALGGVASGGGGSSGGGASIGSDDDQAGRLEDSRGDMTIIFQGGRFLDMGDPRQEELFVQALADVTGRRVVVIDQ